MDFISKYKRYRLWLQPARYLHDNFGQRTFQQGICARFEEGKFNTTDQELIKLMKASPRYGIDFHSMEQDKVEELSDGAKTQIKNEKEAMDKTNTSCPECAFKAETYLGLLSHIRSKHKKK